MRKPFLLSLLVALLTTLSTHAYDFQSGDLYYNTTSNTTVEVTYENQWHSLSYQRLTTATIPETVTNNGTTYSVTSIGSSAFYDCSSLTSITIPNSVTSIGAHAFCDCSSLTSITLPNSVTSIGDYAFSGCSSITSITIPNSVTSIGYGTFNGCTSLPVEDNLRYADTYLVGAVDRSLSTYTIKAGTKWIGGYAFSRCSSLTSITIPNSVTSIRNGTFSGCSSLTSITIPNSVTSIGEYAFENCSSLTSITIPNSVTSIGSYAFQNCSSLTSVSLGNSVTSIGDKAFYECSSLTSVTSLSCTPPSCKNDAFNCTPSKMTLVVPSNSLASYKSAFPWRFFTSFEKCLSMFVRSSNSTMGVAQIEQDVDCDSVAIISATANYGYHFKQWNDGNTDNPRTIKLTQDTTFTAEFAPNQYTLTTTTNYAERGTAHGDTIADYLTEIQVSATANYGYHFTQWSDRNTNNPRTISLTKDINLVALFEKNQYAITTSCNAEQGTISGTQEAEYLDEVTISATANYGYHFSQWSDGNTDNPRTFTLTQDTAFAAEFAPNQYTLTTTTNYAERGIAQGDTIADYLSEIQVSATANYGYHFTQWSDGNTDNPRTISLTKDTNLVALFEKNQYTITTTCNAEQGTISGTQVAEYLDEITLNVLPNVGWHFTQWNDGNTDNPRTFTLTQDTTFAAEFAMDYSGKCGDDLYWAYSNQEIKITGSGAMYNYTESTMPWTLFRDSIMTVRVGNNATSIGEYAFANTRKLAELQIGTGVEDIGANAFAGCNRLYNIYCYPVYPPLAVQSSFANYNVYLHIPCEAKEEYSLDLVWGLFKYIECLDSEMGIDDPQVPIENVHQDKIEKLLRNGQVLIIRNGETYDMMGQRL